MTSRSTPTPAANARADATPTGTVARVAQLLRVLAESEGDASLGDIAQRMKLPHSTTHRLLNLLAEQGFVDRGQTARSYRAGLELLRVAGLVTARAQLTDVAHAFMQAVVDASNETCMLSVYMHRTGGAMVAKRLRSSRSWYSLPYSVVVCQCGSPLSVRRLSTCTWYEPPWSKPIAKRLSFSSTYSLFT